MFLSARRISMIKKFLDYLYYVYEFLYQYIPFSSWSYIRFHQPSVKKEIGMFQLSQSDKVLHIGCGAIPYTSIVIARETNVQVLGIDNNSRIVDLATSYLKRHNLADKVRIEMGDGQNYDVSSFDVIIISYGVADQDLVLRNVLEAAKDEARIILRKSTAKKNDYIDSIVKDLSTCSLRLLLTQESILIVKKDQK